MKRLAFLLSWIFATSGSLAQDWLGNIADRHAGVLGMHVQPASLVSSPYWYDINVFGLNTVGYNVDVVENLANFDVNKPNGFLRNEKDFLVRAVVQLPSFTWRINDTNAVGFSIKSRSIWYTEDPEGGFIRMLMNDFEDRESYGKPFSNRTLSSHANWWTDFGGTYARNIWRGQKHRLDGGITVKYVASNASGYFRMDNLTFVLANADTIERVSGRLRFAFNNTLDELSDGKVGALFNQSTWGLSLGFEYGFSPDGKTEKVRLGISILDIGRLKYSSTSTSGEYNLDGANIAMHRFREAASLSELANVFKEEFGKISLTRTDFFVYLPTQLSVQGDYHITRNWYVNLSAYMPIYGKETRINQTRNFAGYLLTPRFEKDHWGLQLPIGYNALSGFGAGFGARFGPLYIGSSNLIRTIFVDRDSRRLHGYFGMRINKLWERKGSKQKEA